MTKINRRRFLMAATTACAGIVPSSARTEAIARPYELPRFDGEKGQFRRDYWFIKREFDPRPDAASKEAGRPTIDFGRGNIAMCLTPTTSRWKFQ